MKKTYIKPETMTVVLRPVSLLQDSIPLSKSEASVNNEGYYNNSLGKQGFGGWEDDVEPGEDY